MKSIFLYTLIIFCTLVFLGNTSLQAAQVQEEHSTQFNKVDPQKSKGNSQGGKNAGEGEGDTDREKKQKNEKEQAKKQRVAAKSDDSSFGMLKDLFQSTFDYFYAPDSSKTEGIGRQKG